MTKEEAIKVAKEKYPSPKTQNYNDTMANNINYMFNFLIQRSKRQAFVEGVLYALNPNNI